MVNAMMKKIKTCFHALTLLVPLLLGSSPSTSWAQANYPNRPITWVVPYAAGGATDVLIRIIARKLADELGQPVVVNNKPGGGTMIGAQFVARAPADGYTILAAVVANMATAPLLSATPAGYDPLKDFDAISLITSNPLLLVASKSSQISKLSDVLRMAKENPGILAIASYGQGTPSHLGIELLKGAAGIDVIHIPYKGSAPALIDLLGGRVPLMMDILPSHIKTLETGDVVGLAIGQKLRSPLAPKIPTFAEEGVAGLDATTWVGVVAPAGTPKEAIDRLNQALRRALSDSQVVESLTLQGMPAQHSTAQEFSLIIRSGYAKWAGIIKSANIKPE
jgi:tripartite-type tricarboxylate transporter receptor subunit TctC